MNRYRLQFASLDPAVDQPHCFEVPNIGTALIVAEINATGREAEIWQGSKRVARLEPRKDAATAYWQVSN